MRSHAIACKANAIGSCTPNHGRTPWEIGHPDLPRQRERPRVASPGGVLFPAFAKEAHAAQEFGKTSLYGIFSALKHPGARLLAPEAGARLRPAHVRRVVMLRRERREAGFATHKAQCACTNCRLATAGNTEHRSNTLQRYGLRCRPVRAALPWRMPKRGRRCFARTEAQRQSGGASRWPPVRIRFVHHWKAQMVRASV